MTSLNQVGRSEDNCQRQKNTCGKKEGDSWKEAQLRRRKNWKTEKLIEKKGKKSEEEKKQSVGKKVKEKEKLEKQMQCGHRSHHPNVY